MGANSKYLHSHEDQCDSVWLSACHTRSSPVNPSSYHAFCACKFVLDGMDQSQRMGKRKGEILTIKEQAQVSNNFPQIFFYSDFTKATLVNRKQVMCKIISTEGNIIGDLLKSIHGLYDPIRFRDQRARDSSAICKGIAPVHFGSLVLLTLNKLQVWLIE